MAHVPLAVVGMACRLPGAQDVASLWRNVVSDTVSIKALPPERFHRERYYDPEIGAYGKSYSAIGGLIEETRFDPTGLGLDGADLAAIDRAHLWALDVARATVVDSGLDPASLAARKVAAVIGHARGSMLSSDLAFGCAVEGLMESAVMVPELGSLSGEARLGIGREAVARVRRRFPSRGGQDLASTLAAGLAGRIAKAFDLKGRAMVVDAACASSFAALDVAARALANGRLDAALVGGASYSQELSVVLFAQSRALSPDGSFPFDERANGFISSDGVAFFLVMRLDDALACGARIRAVIRGIGGACDGKGKALWAPRKEGQVLAMRRAYEGSGVDPGSIDLIEAHATSTPVGDATEIAAVEEVFGAAVRAEGRRLPIGSIKGNIGHTRETAGAAALVKVIAAMEAGTLPPTGGLVTPSKSIPWSDVVASPQREAASWRARGVRRAGVSAFGIGGLDFHVVVEEPPPERRVFASAGLELPPTAARSERSLDVAIVGIGLRVANASNPEELWSRLSEGTPAFVEAPADRWSKELFVAEPPPKPYRTHSARGSFVEGFRPDWRRYKVPPKLVEQNDPLQFMLLESASDALDDAGVDLSRIDRTRVATVMGTTFGSDYALDLSLAIRAPELGEAIAEVAGRAKERGLIDAITSAVRRALPTIDEDSSGSFSSSTLASRVAKTLDLMGPTYTIDASCGASMASLEAACEALASGECDLAIHGGGDRAMRVQRFAAYSNAEVLSKREAPAPYSDVADGLLPGEGAAVLLLERLDDAVAHGRKIYAVIRGVGSASAGRKGSTEEPASDGLARATQAALADARLTPGQVSVVEGHGAAIPAYDRAELEALAKTFERQPEGSIRLDSLKRLYGHTAGAAGALSLAKAALALSRGEWPRSASPEPDAQALPRGFALKAPRATPMTGAALVSSLSFSGVAHQVVLGPAPEGSRRVAKRPPSGVTVAIARGATIELAIADAERRAEDLFSEGAVGHGPAAIALVAADRADLDAKLASAKRALAARPLLRKQGVFVRRGAPVERKIAFSFSGQGSQYGGMSAVLAREVPEASAVLDRADRWCSGHGLPPISTVMGGREIPDDVFWVQASVLVADLMAYAAVRAAGVTPDVVTGHSFGDYAALVAAEAWTLETALDATRMRSRGIEATVEPGAMISAAAGRREVEAVLAKITGRGVIVPSNVNAPAQTVVSGTPAAIEAAIAELAKAGIEARRLAVPRAFHSPLMAGARRALDEGLASLELSAPKIPYLSSVSGELEREPSQIRASLVEQLTRPVDFVAQIERLAKDGVGLFVECGPRSVLTGLTEEIVAGREIDAVPTDDASRAGAWALARVRAAALLRAPSADDVAAALPGDALVLLEGAEARALLDRPGFAEFWARSRAPVITLVRSLWQSEDEARQAAEAEKKAAEQAAAELALQAASRRPSVTPTLLPAAPLPQRDEIQRFLVDALAAQTGYPRDLIDPNADLEADLGIDTVKQAQVLGKARDQYQLRAEGSVTLSDFTTVTKIVDYVSSRLEARAKEAPRPARPRAPVVDITVRRTQRPQGAITAPPARPTELAPPPRVEAAPAPEPAVIPELDSTPVEVLRLEGSAKEIGRQHGETMRAHIRATMDRYERFLGDQRLSALAVPEATRLLPGLFDRDTLEELEGIAEAAGVPVEHLLAYNLDAALFPAFTSGCTQVVRTAKANGGTMIHAVNEDSPLLVHLGGSAPRVVQLRRRDGGRTTVAFSLAGQVAGPNAASELGLTITSTTLLDGPTPQGLPEGLPHPQLVKRMIEGATSLDHAVQLALAARRSGRWSLLVSSASEDRAVYLEYDGPEILARREVSDVLVTANHRVDRADAEAVPPHSRHRERRACALFGGAEPRSAEDITRALRDRYDLAREREVKHPTMNTVRRADNVMSLVIEPGARRLHVTDRVEAPAHAGAAVFLTLDYVQGSTPRPRPRPTVEPPEPPRGSALARPRGLGREGSGLASCDEIMRRSVVRVIAEPTPPAKESWSAKHALILGGGPTAEAIAKALEARGAKVELAADADAALARLGARHDAIGCVLPPPSPSATWAERRKIALEGPFRLLRAWAPPRPATLFSITTQGGALGFDNLAQGAPEHAAVVALLKALRREHEGLRAQAIDVAPGTLPAEIAQALLAELDAGSPHLEVGLLRQRRVRLAMPLLPAEDFTQGAERLPRSWIITGGARGITAAIAQRLARLYHPRLHLFGRQPYPAGAEPLSGEDLERAKKARYAQLKAERPNLSALEWAKEAESFEKNAEISRTLIALAEAGSEVHYHAVDLADDAAVARTLEAIRALGPIEGIVHGAGVEIAKAIAKKTDAIFEATVGAKVDGLVHLLTHTAEDPIGHIVAFSSVSGRFGGHGQADYTLANDTMSRLLAAERLARPGLRAASIAWPAWGEVGLAARSSARAFLEQTGQRFMSPAEGANHFMRELWCGLPEPEITISDGLPALDLDHLLVRDEELGAWRAREAAVSATPLLGHLVLDTPQRTITETTLSADSPFLAQHRMGTTPILPGVIALEALSELAGLESDRFTAGELVIHAPLKIADRTRVRLDRDGDRLSLTATTRRPDGIVLEAERPYVTGKRLPRRPLPVKAAPRWPSGEAGIAYPYPTTPDPSSGSRAIFHGPVFRAVEAVLPTGPASGLARLVVPPVEALIPGTKPDRWRLPAALLDGALQASGLLARIVFDAFALPAGFGRIDVSPRAVLASGEIVLVEIELARDGEDVVAKLLGFAAGEPLFFLEGYRARGPRAS